MKKQTICAIICRMRILELSSHSVGLMVTFEGNSTVTVSYVEGGDPVTLSVSVNITSNTTEYVERSVTVRIACCLY